MTKLKKLVVEFLEILETVEESSSGRKFHPVTIESCRVMLTRRIGELLTEIKDMVSR